MNKRRRWKAKSKRAVDRALRLVPRDLSTTYRERNAQRVIGFPLEPRTADDAEAMAAGLAVIAQRRQMLERLVGR